MVVQIHRLSFARFVPAGWLVALCLFGGASRYDEWQQLVVPVLSAAVLLTALWVPDRSDYLAKRSLWVFLAAIAVVLAIQLIPLPPAVWMSLPGREPFAAGANLVGMQDEWRPLTLTPDLTWASLFSLLPVTATLAIAPTTRSPATGPLIWAMLIVFSVSTVLGVAQALGAESLALYDQTNVGSAVGLFANRNHHAIFLSLSFPMLAFLTVTNRFSSSSSSINKVGGLALAALYLVAIIQAGSRLGLVLAALMLGAVIAAIALKYFPMAKADRRRTFRISPLSQPRSMVAIGIAGAGFAVALILILVRSAAFDRLTQFDVTYDSRAQTLPMLIEMAKTFSPFGSGFGSFASVFRHFEPFETLRYTYLNQAHNDVLQVLIEGGLAGLLLMIFALVALVRQFIRLSHVPPTMERALSLVGCLMVTALFVASAVDYPLRTPLLAGFFTFAAVWAFSPRETPSNPTSESQLPSHPPPPR